MDKFWRAKYWFDEAIENALFRLVVETIIASLFSAIWGLASKPMTSPELFLLCVTTLLIAVASLHVYRLAHKNQDIKGNFRAGARLLVRDIEGPRQFQVAAYPHELKRQTIEDRAFRLKDILNKDGLISDRKFDHCTIVGPATIVLMGDVPRLERAFHHCTWDLPHWEFLESQEDHPDNDGCIYSFETQYTQCHFIGIKFRIKEKEVIAIKKGLYASLGTLLERTRTSIPHS